MITENKDQLIDIYDIWYEPFWLQGWFKILICLFIMIMTIILFYYFYKKYIYKTIVIDCSVIAYRDLDSLNKIHIVTAQDSKDCYFSLSSIVKNYLACRYHLIFTHLTDKEIIKQAALYMSDDLAYMLANIFKNMTLIKFEHEIAASQKLEKDIALVREFIQQTTVQYAMKEN